MSQSDGTRTTLPRAAPPARSFAVTQGYMDTDFAAPQLLAVPRERVRLPAWISVPPSRVVSGSVFGAGGTLREFADHVVGQDVGDPCQFQSGHQVDRERVGA